MFLINNKKFLYVIILLLISINVHAKNTIIVASTTSTYDTGLLDLINKRFTDKFKINVKVLSLGTGQALRTAKDGNVEVILVHHTPSELKFMKQGYGLERNEIMYNDYVLVGPKKDNEQCNSVEAKLKTIFDNKQLFISRGDDSGTHRKELEMWKLTEIIIDRNQNWYLSVGQGMGNTLLITNEKNAYTLSDRSTWIAFNKKENLKIVCENFPPLFNQYGLILVNPKLNKNLNIKDAKIYVDWFKTNEVKNLINSFESKGIQLFYYNFN